MGHNLDIKTGKRGRCNRTLSSRKCNASLAENPQWWGKWSSWKILILATQKKDIFVRSGKSGSTGAIDRLKAAPSAFCMMTTVSSVITIINFNINSIIRIQEMNEVLLSCVMRMTVNRWRLNNHWRAGYRSLKALSGSLLRKMTTQEHQEEIQQERVY